MSSHSRSKKVARMRRISSSDEEDDHVPSSQQPRSQRPTGRSVGRRGGSRDRPSTGRDTQASQSQRSQASQSQFLSQFEASQSDIGRGKKAKPLSDEELRKLSQNVAGFLLDWDQKENSACPRSVLVKHVIMPENQGHFKQIMDEAQKQLGRIGEAYRVVGNGFNVLLISKLQNAKISKNEEESDNFLIPSGVNKKEAKLTNSIRNFILGLILVSEGEGVKEGELEHLWKKMNVDAIEWMDEEDKKKQLTFGSFIKSEVSNMFLVKKTVTDDEKVKENWYCWGERATAEIPKLLPYIAICAVKGVDPVRSTRYKEYLHEQQTSFPFVKSEMQPETAHKFTKFDFDV